LGKQKLGKEGRFQIQICFRSRSVGAKNPERLHRELQSERCYAKAVPFRGGVQQTPISKMGEPASKERGDNQSLRLRWENIRVGVCQKRGWRCPKKRGWILKNDLPLKVGREAVAAPTKALILLAGGTEGFQNPSGERNSARKGKKRPPAEESREAPEGMTRPAHLAPHRPSERERLINISIAITLRYKHKTAGWRRRAVPVCDGWSR